MDILKMLEDEHLIKQVYTRYCDVIDTKTFDQLSDVFTEDCIGDYRDTNGQIREGLAPLVSGLYVTMGPDSCCGATHHNVLNFRIQSDGSDHATAQVHFYAVHRGVRAMEGELFTCWGEYDDELTRTDQGWRVSRRKYTNFVVDGNKGVIRNGNDTTPGRL
jgi:3-phenylpropionate/cinnamic acid dioxygenase small subunit